MESVVVLDNFSTHKNAAFLDRIANVNGVVCHLPPYSPDYNPVRVFISVFCFIPHRSRLTRRLNPYSVKPKRGSGGTNSGRSGKMMGSR